MLDSPTAAAPGATVTTCESGSCSSVTSTVISFVMLAIGRRCAGARAASTSPVAPFTTTYARAATGGGPASADGAARRATAATTNQTRTLLRLLTELLAEDREERPARLEAELGEEDAPAAGLVEADHAPVVGERREERA